MNGLHFREWLVTESLNPKVLLPYINHRKELRLQRHGKHTIDDDHLRMDYTEGMERLHDLFSHESNFPILVRKVMRQYEITRDRMQEKARRIEAYSHAYQQTEPDNDLWMFVRALEDISNGKAPNLEELL
jgi:hypothetical protein